MKKWWIGFIVIVLMLTCALGAYAKPDKYKGGHGKPYIEPVNQVRNDARYIIHRTAEVIYAAQRAVKHGHRYDGLSQAIAHQQKARELYNRGFYRDAIYHSLRARSIAIHIIEINRERPRKSFYRDEMEERYSRSAPRDSQLDFGIDITKVGKDDAVVNLHFELDITE